MQALQDDSTKDWQPARVWGSLRADLLLDLSVLPGLRQLEHGSCPVIRLYIAVPRWRISVAAEI
jgi:hypothetical protein